MMVHELRGVAPVLVERDHSFSMLALLSEPEFGMLGFLESRKLLPLVRRTPQICCLVTTRELARELPEISGWRPLRIHAARSSTFTTI